MLSCREVVENVDALLDGDLSWRKRMAVRMHLLLCHRCRRYERQLRFLLRGLEHLHSPATDAEVRIVLDAIDRNALRDDPAAPAG
jgi:anti-sigma factor ChrR (cupin superfamily)